MQKKVLVVGSDRVGPLQEMFDPEKVEVIEQPMFDEYEKEIKMVITNPYEHLKYLDASGIYPSVPQYIRDSPKVNRNEPCICGSGKKYKKCCGK